MNALKTLVNIINEGLKFKEIYLIEYLKNFREYLNLIVELEGFWPNRSIYRFIDN